MKFKYQELVTIMDDFFSKDMKFEVVAYMPTDVRHPDKDAFLVIYAVRGLMAPYDVFEIPEDKLVGALV